MPCLDTIEVHIRRLTPEDGNGESYWQRFEVPVPPGSSVLAALMQIREEQDGSLAFRASCRSGICGSDGMVINGWPRLACKTQIESVIGPERRLSIEPLFNLTCIKDLVVDQTPFWEQFIAVVPWVVSDPRAAVPEREYRMVMPDEDFGLLSKASDCIFCQLCFAACPVVGLDPQFLGPQALIKAFRFEKDPRDAGSADRAATLDNPQGVWRCRTTFNCTEACPKGIPITQGIQALKRAMLRHEFSR